MNTKAKGATVQQRRILRSLLDNDAILESTCSPYDDSILLDYIKAELNGQDAAALYPAFRAHLDQTPECWQEYNELKQLLWLTQTDQLVEPPGVGNFDFSFLGGATMPLQDNAPLSTASFWRLDAVGRLIIEFSSEVLRSIQLSASQLTYATERTEQGAQVRYQLALQEELADLRVVVTVREMTPQPDRYTLVVESDIPSRGGWPYLADTDVILKRGDETLDQQFTDPFGKAVFSDVHSDDLANLTIEIVPNRE